MKSMIFKTLAIIFIATCGYAQELPDNLVAQTTDSNYQYILYGPDEAGKWRIDRVDANASESAQTTNIYTGPQPFTPAPSKDVEKSLGYNVLTALLTQWVAGVVANGKDNLQVEMTDYYKKTGAPMFTGASADAFRAQNVDPEAKPTSDTFD